MKGLADILALVVVLLLLSMLVSSTVVRTFYSDSREENGDILDVSARRNIAGLTVFSVTLDLDNGYVVVCPVQSDMLGGTLYRLYRNRKPDLPRLRETARVQIGRHSGSVVCRGLATVNAEQETGD